MVELVVVIAVTMVLTALLFPTLAVVRNNVRVVVCSSNLRQMGLGINIFAGDHNAQLPRSISLQSNPSLSNPQELMAAHVGVHQRNWDGLGLLWMEHYCDAEECFYCPSHHGDHPYERYIDEWRYGPSDGSRIYTNYHYGGHLDWTDGKRRGLDRGSSMILVTDGLRTQLDFNHVEGMNLLFGDGSVQWSIQVQPVEDYVPADDKLKPPPSYKQLWRAIEKVNKK